MRKAYQILVGKPERKTLAYMGGWGFNWSSRGPSGGPLWFQ